MNNHGLLVEKYRPITLDNFIGNETLKDQIQECLDTNELVNMTLAGPAGCGKTTLAKLIVKNLDCDYLMINASDERGIETIRDKVKGFASTMSFKPLKVIILDEADYLTIQAQASLRNIIETFSNTTRFILTCNFPERIFGPVLSRCPAQIIYPPNKNIFARHLDWVMEEENIEYEREDLISLVNKLYPDFRKCLNIIQLSTKDGKLTLAKDVIINNSYKSEILSELQKSKPNWRKIRQTIANSNQNSFEDLFNFLYDKASDYVPGKEGMVAIYVNEYSYQANFRVDKEINCMGLIARLIELKS